MGEQKHLQKFQNLHSHLSWSVAPDSFWRQTQTSSGYLPTSLILEAFLESLTMETRLYLPPERLLYSRPGLGQHQGETKVWTSNPTGEIHSLLREYEVSVA